MIELGFTLAEIKGLLDLRVDEEATCRDVQAQAEEKLDDVEEKIRDLERIRDVLTQLAGACEGEGARRATVPSSMRWRGMGASTAFFLNSLPPDGPSPASWGFPHTNVAD